MAINKGIYKITNICNNKFYIGSSVHMNRRFKEHKSALKRNKHCNYYLQASYNKYGIENFTFEILELCENLVGVEQYYIDILKPEYNLLLLAYRTEGIKRSKETKLKMSLARLGIKYSLETKERMRKAKLGIIYKTGNRIKNIYQMDLKNNIINFFNSITEASKFTNIGRTSINNCLKQLSNTARGFKWRYSND